MNIVFDNVIFSKEKQGGISNYWYELIKRYADNKDCFFFEEKRSGENIFRKQLCLQNIVSHYQLPLPLARLLPVSYHSKADRILYHSSFYRKLITRANVCEITTVHDFIHNKYSPPLNRFLHNSLKFGSIKRARGIICISNNTFADLKKYYNLRKDQKCTVIHNGVSDDYRQLAKEDKKYSNFFNGYNLNEKFLLYVGSRSNYKNFPFVIELLKELPQYKLVVVGNPFLESEKSAIHKSLMDRITVMSGISNTELNILYNYAHALIYPSSYEGFGIPIIEAMKACCPVFALNISCIPEVAGNAAMLFDSLNTSDFIKGIKQLENSDRRMDLMTKGYENSKKFNWSKCINETVSFYESLYKEV